MLQQLDNEEGFSLIEVLVALAVTAVVLGTLFQVTSIVAKSLSKGELKLKALQVAESVLDQLGEERPLHAGIQAGQEQDGSSWILRVSPAPLYDGAAERADPWIRLYRIEIDVIPSGHEGSSVRLSTLRIAAPGDTR